MSEIEIKPKFGEVYKCSFYDETVGTEIKGARPVLIISTKWYNEESSRITILPLTRLFNKSGQQKKSLFMRNKSKSWKPIGKNYDRSSS